MTAAHSSPVHPVSKQTHSPNEKCMPLNNLNPSGNNVLPPPNETLTPAKTLPHSRLFGRLLFAHAQARPQGLRDKKRIPVEEGKLVCYLLSGCSTKSGMDLMFTN